ncbi:hypothetical protein F5884DRAFT_263702 [Xylogone sp. PMI_703]|nr:hypothetical protein F5884DRAFT_263702 [Xylogone sp. PMI_703]
MVTIKQEVADGRILDAGSQRMDPDKARDSTYSRATVEATHPLDPQEAFESELQSTPWGLVMNPQIKHPDRTAPTVLDGYEAQLAPHRNQQGGSSMAATPRSLPRAQVQRQADYQNQLMLLEHENRRRRYMPNMNFRSAPVVSGSNWKPPPGWREGLSPASRRALQYLEQRHRERHRKGKDCPRDKFEEKRRAHHERRLSSNSAQFFTPESTPSVRGGSVDSVWSVNFTPESTPNFQGEKTLSHSQVCPSSTASDQALVQHCYAKPPKNDNHQLARGEDSDGDFHKGPLVIRKRDGRE